MEKYPCPCCGYLTYPVPREDAIAYICPVCFWENDVFVTSDDEPSDENHGISLRTAQENYRSFGACAHDAPLCQRAEAGGNSTIEKTQDLHLAGPAFFHAAMQKMGYSPSSTARRRRTLPSSAASMVWISASRSRLSVPPRGR